ncbi:hypothetical protein CF319_g9649 [Tilletia indica]|nr:hypothetical protein CF319_g9649 [Tilletia indica]
MYSRSLIALLPLLAVTLALPGQDRRLLPIKADVGADLQVGALPIKADVNATVNVGGLIPAVDNPTNAHTPIYHPHHQNHPNWEPIPRPFPLPHLPLPHPKNGGGNSGKGHNNGVHWNDGEAHATWFQTADVHGSGNSTVKLNEGGSGYLPALGGDFYANSGVKWNPSALEVGFAAGIAHNSVGGGYTFTPEGISVGAGITYKGRSVSFSLSIDDNGQVRSSITGDHLICSGYKSKAECDRD